MAQKTEPALTSGALLTELCGLLDTTRRHVAQTAKIVSTLSTQWVGVLQAQRHRAVALAHERAALAKPSALAAGAWQAPKARSKKKGGNA